MSNTSPSKQRTKALSSGSEQENLDFLRRFPNIKAWEYINALGDDSEFLEEPARRTVRKIWFEHLESRDIGRKSRYFATLELPIDLPLHKGLLLEVFDLALKSFPWIAHELLSRHGGPTPSFANGHKIDGNILHLTTAHKRALVLRDVLDAIEGYAPQERNAIIQSTDTAGRTVLTIAIENSDLESIHLLIKAQPQLLKMTWGTAKDTPLHSAVRLAEEEEIEVDFILGIVKAIVECSPESLCARNVDGNPPYCCARMLPSARPEVGSRVTELLKIYIIRYLKDDIKKARKALYGDSDKELGINFQDFNQPSHDFTRFVNDLWTYRSFMKDLEFEDSLFYIILPDFFHRDTTQFHDEVEKLFHWLEDKGVKSIIELEIPDSIEKPMDDDFIQNIVLDRFFVTDLRWRKMDTNAEVFTDSEKSKSSLRSLQLYSSGNWGVLYHWASSDGLKKCSQLNDVRIRIIQRKLSRKPRYPHRLPAYKEQAEKLFTAIELPCQVEIGDFDIAVLNIPGEDTSYTTDLGISREYKNCHDTLKAIIDCESSPRVQNLKIKPVKVAIIDVGADKVRTTISSNIKEGISYVTSEYGKYELPWWFVTDSHGAQMASLVCEVNPYCQLYIARVGRGRKDVDLNNAAAAVEWAITRDVDIISISWTTTENHDRLRNAIQNADNKSIIVIGSTADEGKDGGDIYPAGWPSVLTVSALDATGRRRGVSQKSVDLLVLGEDVPANGPNYITAKSKENVSGSSVATALASGIASLLLVCTRLANMKPEHWMYFRRREEMLRLFKHMHNNDNHVKPSLLFRDGFKIKQPKDAWTKTFCHPRECLSSESVMVGQTVSETEPSSRSTPFYSAVSVQ